MLLQEFYKRIHSFICRIHIYLNSSFEGGRAIQRPIILWYNNIKRVSGLNWIAAAQNRENWTHKRGSMLNSESTRLIKKKKIYWLTTNIMPTSWYIFRADLFYCSNRRYIHANNPCIVTSWEFILLIIYDFCSLMVIILTSSERVKWEIYGVYPVL